MAIDNDRFKKAHQFSWKTLVKIAVAVVDIYLDAGSIVKSAKSIWNDIKGLPDDLKDAWKDMGDLFHDGGKVGPFSNVLLQSMRLALWERRINFSVPVATHIGRVSYTSPPVCKHQNQRCAKPQHRGFETHWRHSALIGPQQRRSARTHFVMLIQPSMNKAATRRNGFDFQALEDFFKNSDMKALKKDWSNINTLVKNVTNLYNNDKNKITDEWNQLKKHFNQVRVVPVNPEYPFRRSGSFRKGLIRESLDIPVLIPGIVCFACLLDRCVVLEQLVQVS